MTGLSDHNGFVLEEVKYNKLANAVVFKAAFNYTFFEVAEEAENLYNKQN